jgi:cyclase
MSSTDRRRFLEMAAGGVGALWLGVPSEGLVARAQAASPSGALDVVPLRGGLLQLTGAGGNIVVAANDAGIAMVDSGAPESGDAVLDLLAERFPGAAVRLLLNTHWHLDHTGGNDAVGRAGATIVAHESTRLWMSTQFFVDWQDRTYEPRAPEARPTETFYSSDRQPIRVAHGDTQIEYGLLREAHTDGDIYVRFPAENVIVAGGAVTVDEYPVVDYITGGALDGLLGATEKLLAMCDAETLLVPASGRVLGRADLVAQRDMVATVLERMQAAARRGKSVAEMMAEGITAEFDERWGRNTARFLDNAYKSLWGLGP